MIYNNNFYNIQKSGSFLSAQEIVPFLISTFHPSSVLDIGCGLGTWLKVFQESGIEDIIGIDGDYVDKKSLFINEKNFISADLTKPISLSRAFDLVVSLEVGEHISKDLDELYFENIIRHGQIVYFSAAIPFQSGTNHVNEQWQDYWAQKFTKHDYVICDIIRPKFWNDDRIQTHYIQNGLVYIKKQLIDKYPNVHPYLVDINSPISVVHPKTFISKIDPRYQSVQLELQAFLKVVVERIKSRLHGNK